MTRVLGVTFEHLREPLGVGSARPRLSWQVRTSVPGWAQAGYELAVDGEPAGRVDSADSVLVPWPWADLRSRQRAQVRVRVWGADGMGTDWSASTVVEAGLLSPVDWTAAAISPPLTMHRPAPGPGLRLRREFRARPAIAAARLYLTAHGVCEVELNGRPVGTDVLAPGWTSYRHRLRYHTYDVTGLLSAGDNTIDATVADGWFRGHLGYHDLSQVYGDRLALVAQLEIGYADGSTDVVGTDDAWTCAPGPIGATGLYEGERYDARPVAHEWQADEWQAVEVVPFDPAGLVAPSGPPVRRTAMLRPAAISATPAGHSIVDFGQNISGRLRITVDGPTGRTVVLRHAEVLEDGELATGPLRSATQRDEYTLAGTGREVWEPRFTVHGFRYAEVRGWPGELRAEDVQAVICHTDMRRTGWFGCSDPLLNRLHDNVVWSMRDNFVDLPTDCPQRDERLGWTGDIQVFAPTASFLFDCAGLLTSWLADVAAEQRQLGTVPPFVPWLPLGELKAAAAWGDAAVIVPWVLYQRFGDLGVLRAQYPSMTAWVDDIAERAGDSMRWHSGFQYGDWLDPAAPADDPGAALTDKYLVATAYFAESTRIVGEVAGLLGAGDDQRRYADRAAVIRQAFNDAYVTPSGRLSSDTQTAHALALQFDLLPTAGQRTAAGRRLAELVADAGYRIATGFVGTPLICDALETAGAVDAAYRLLRQTECPSWLYPVTMGATTVWERWDSLRPDGRLNSNRMTSFNHYALGAVADWMHRTVAGLAPAAPGYRRIRVAPRPGGGLTHASAEHHSPYGRAAVAWRRDGGTFNLDLTVAPNTQAQVELPDGSAPAVVGAGLHSFSCPVRPAAADPVAGTSHPRGH
jgi:alpha-L-rhamnosidase